jgi:hypothetical protein
MRPMNRLVTLAITFALVAVPLTAQANHRPTSYCSQTGDICQSTTRVDGVRLLRITLAGGFFLRYRLCVTAPSGDTTCKRFGMHERPNGTFTSSIRWAKQFGSHGAGPYDVAWRSLPGGSRVGRILGFHV